MMAARKARRQAAGFTLLEVLLAMTLLAVMMSVLFASFRICVDSWEKGERRAFEVGRMAVIQGFLREHLERALPLTDDFTEEGSVFSFQGEKNWLEFVSSMPAAGGRGGLQLFRIELVRARDGNDLKVTLRPFYPTFEDAEPPKEEVIILEEVEKMEFAYFGPDEVGNEDTWQEQWEEKQQLPRLLRVDVVIRHERPWPPLLIAPKLQTRQTRI